MKTNMVPCVAARGAIWPGSPCPNFGLEPKNILPIGPCWAHSLKPKVRLRFDH